MHLLLGVSSEPVEGISQGSSGVLRQRRVGTTRIPSGSEGGESGHSALSRFNRDCHVRVAASGHRGWKLLLLGVGSENRVRSILKAILVEVCVFT